MSQRNKTVRKIPKKRGRGRPPLGDHAATLTVPIVLTANLVAKLDEWRKREGIKTRSAAIRRFIEEGLERGKR